MSKLNPTANVLVQKYVRQSSTPSPPKKKRGLQAEINKLDAIQRTVLNENIDYAELIRLRIELNKLMDSIESKLIQS